jgi:hypothetical protein
LSDTPVQDTVECGENAASKEHVQSPRWRRNVAEITAAKISVCVLEGAEWHSLDAPEHESIRALLSDPRKMAWIDILGDLEPVRTAFAAIAQDCQPLEGLDPSRAAQGGENPPARPPKAKAFHDSVFARMYWLGIRPTPAPHELMAQEINLELVAEEIHLIVGKTFAVTLRYPCLAWELDRMVGKGTPDPYRGNDAGLDASRVRRGVAEFRDRFQRPNGGQAFGLEVAAVVLDHVVDSVFDSLNGLRQRADELEEDVLKGAWLWGAKNKQTHPPLEDTMLGLRRLLRHVRWAFIPADEIDEFCSGPFLGIEAQDPGIKFTFADLGHEADRTVASVRDVTEQLEHTVELSNTMKADRLNSTMYALTAVATILLIPTLIAGIYGMNFRHIPELNWRLGYWGALVAMIVLGMGVWFGIRAYLRRQSRGTSVPSQKN